MKYTSIDTETTGLDPENCQLLEFGIIIEDTSKKLSFEEIPKFRAIIYHEQIKGTAIALNMNIRLLKIFSDYEKIHQDYASNKVTTEDVKKFVSDNNLMNIESLAENFYDFLIKNGYEDYSGRIITLNVAGKNFGMFDYNFIKMIPNIEKFVRFKSRLLDPAILCVNWEEDKELPSLDECKKRLNIDGAVSHDAVEDAWDVIQVLRKYY